MSEIDAMDATEPYRVGMLEQGGPVLYAAVAAGVPSACSLGFAAATQQQLLQPFVTLDAAECASASLGLLLLQQQW